MSLFWPGYKGVYSYLYVKDIIVKFTNIENTKKEEKIKCGVFMNNLCIM